MGGRECEAWTPLTLFPSRVLFFPSALAPWNHTLSLRMQNYAVVINRGCYALDGPRSLIVPFISVVPRHRDIPFVFPATSASLPPPP